jgi:hypothetical protein
MQNGIINLEGMGGMRIEEIENNLLCRMALLIWKAWEACELKKLRTVSYGRSYGIANSCKYQYFRLARDAW